MKHEEWESKIAPSESEFREYLDENEPEVVICGLEYSAGYALQEVDPIAFRGAYLDWLDGEWEAYQEENAEEEEEEEAGSFGGVE